MGHKERGSARNHSLLNYNFNDDGNIFDIPVLDHLIFTSEGYLSFAEEGLL
ncbi:JAB domain-containing protein [Desertivirga xinjiangensis]|uniref:JAB domain-containing protein n=1 Tax=Desertivirga xinjiangensis TaxID=539206 RepID=UPI0034E1D553